MKKVFVFVSILLFVSSSAFAAQVYSSGGTLTVGVAPQKTETMGLSNNVSAVYENGGATNPQWYAIATSHLGGTQVYGTAQDVTSLYKLVVEKTPGVAATFTGMPADSTASETWSSGVWEVL